MPSRRLQIRLREFVRDILDQMISNLHRRASLNLSFGEYAAFLTIEERSDFALTELRRTPDNQHEQQQIEKGAHASFAEHYR